MWQQANIQALDRLRSSRPVLTRLISAQASAPRLAPNTITHAGPPIRWESMCGPMRGAIIAGILFEGWAKTPAEAHHLVQEGAVTFLPNHAVRRVAPMAGVITPSMPLLEVTNVTFGNKAYVPIHEGLGQSTGFGAYSPQVLHRLTWIAQVLSPALSSLLAAHGPIPLLPFLQGGLAMGDELHQRNLGASALFFRHIAPLLVTTAPERAHLPSIFSYFAEQEHFFLNLAMASAKAAADSIRDIPFCTLVTAMSRNGVNFGIQVSALGDQWLEAPCSPPVGLFFPNYGVGDANPDLGDSAILEVWGLGGAAMGSAPAVLPFLGGGGAREAAHITEELDLITAGTNDALPIPAMGSRGVPTGIDIISVVETGITPLINTGIAHRLPGIGQIGAGAIRAPLSCFEQALLAYGASIGL